MSALLVFLQHENGELLKGTRVSIEAATQLAKAWGKSELIGVALGTQAKAAAENAGKCGIQKVYVSEDSAYEKYLAASYAAAVLKARELSGADTLVALASTTGKDLMARISGVLDAGQASDVLAVNSDGSLKRPMYAGDVLADVEITTDMKVVTVRGTAFTPVEPGGGSAEVISLDGVTVPDNAGEVTGLELSESERPELSAAEVVVSGGRALQSEENFQKYLFPLADALGAAVGASRAAVDSGYAPNDWQVGQTGKVVAPNLYIAVGISGAIQHVAGMKDSKTIVAINKDPEAPIFELADYGLVGDLYDILPELTEAINRVKGA